jgi:hypothetical protein
VALPQSAFAPVVTPPPAERRVGSDPARPHSWNRSLTASYRGRERAPARSGT